MHTATEKLSRIGSADPKCVTSNFQVKFFTENCTKTKNIGPTLRKAQYKDVSMRTIEILQRARSLKANCCFNVHNVHLKLASPIS